MIKEISEIYIESLAYEGEGVGHLGGKAVFVADSVPGDLLKIEITTQKKGFARGKIVEIIKPSELRIKPACALAKICGGCQWQHVDYNEQLRAKKKIVEDNFKRISNLDISVKEVIPSDCNLEYRCKVQYPVGQTKVSKRILAGYYEKGTHEIVNIKHCPVQPEIIDRITESIRKGAKELTLTAYNEKTKKGLLRHLVFRYSLSSKELLLIIVLNSNKIPHEIFELAKRIKEEFREITGILTNFNTSHTNIILGAETELVIGRDYIKEILESKKFKISAGSFFQVNPATAVKMFNTVRNIIEEKVKNPDVLDVYAGVGTFAIWLKDIAKNITMIEEFPNAIRDARENIESNNAQNISIIEGNADSALQDLITNKAEFDVAILDPPRKGCSEIVLDAATRLTKKYIIYVSCNPSTLARDMQIFYEKGFIPEFIQPVDMFCHTYHVESIAVLRK